MSASAPAQKWYPAQPAPALKKSRKTPGAAKLRKSLVPGAVLIVLTGRYRGKRVVLLRTNTDGTLVVTGPFKINGVPIRRVNARYVIATSTVVPVAGIDTAKFDEAYFARDKASKANKITDEQLFGDAPVAKKEVKAERIQDQKTVDSALLAEIKKTPLLKAYLASSFSLKNGDRPHLLKF